MTWQVAEWRCAFVLKKLQARKAHESAVVDQTVELVRLTPGPPQDNTRGTWTLVSRSVEVKRDLSIYTNARSLIPKRDELLAYIDMERLHMVAITETWATSDHLMTAFTIPGYENFHKNRLHKKGGGVICYIKSDYPAVILSKQDSEKYDTVYIEVVTSKHNKLTIGTVCRPPKQQAADDSALYADIQAMTQNKQSVIIGDFNCPNIDWTTLSGDQEENRLLEMLVDANRYPTDERK